VPPADEARLGPTIGWMLAGLPQMQGPAFGALDRPVVLELTGPGGGTWSVVGTGEGYVAVEPGTASGSGAVVTSDGHSFVLWGTKRDDWRNHVTIDGDEGLASSFLDTLNII
jgi:hypothetical protein